MRSSHTNHTERIPHDPDQTYHQNKNVKSTHRMYFCFCLKLKERLSLVRKSRRGGVGVGAAAILFLGINWCPAAEHVTWPSACMGVLGGVSDISTATPGCHGNRSTKGGEGCRAEQLICTNREFDGGFNCTCWCVKKLRLIEHHSKKEELSEKVGNRD